MFFFLTLHEAASQSGTIEPDILPSFNSTLNLVNKPSHSHQTFREYLTT
jgi:hypothetical protein